MISEIEKKITAIQYEVYKNNKSIEVLSEISGLMMELYQALYPQNFGGFFQPLSPTIGYTHCHYLDLSKLHIQGDNKYRIKCNIFTNEVEDLPPILQPRSPVQLIHTVHLLSCIQHEYHEKHLAPLHFENKEQIMDGGTFFISPQGWLVYDCPAIPNHGTVYFSEQWRTDIVISDWNIYENLQKNTSELLQYINTWNNKALLELIRYRILFPNFLEWVNSNPITLQVGNCSETIKNQWSNIHFTNGLLGLHEITGQSRNACVKKYQEHIDEYRHKNDFFDQVFFVGNGTLDNDEAFMHYNHDFYKILQWRYSLKCRFYVPNPHGLYDQPLTEPEYILEQLRSYLESSGGGKCLFTLGLHGQQDGSASYFGGSFQKKHFDALFDLAREFDTLQILIISCWNSMKAQSLVGNIIMSSSRQVSYANYVKILTKHLYNGSTLYQAHLLSMMTYHDSLLPTSFYDDEGVPQQICPLIVDTQSGTYNVSAYLFSLLQ